MKILSRLPFFEERSEVSTPDGILEVKPYQIIVMVSITARSVTELDPGAPRIPAILDTGHNHNLADSARATRPLGEVEGGGTGSDPRRECPSSARACECLDPPEPAWDERRGQCSAL
jgi:hypothetical protein